MSEPEENLYLLHKAVFDGNLEEVKKQIALTEISAKDIHGGFNFFFLAPILW